MHSSFTSIDLLPSSLNVSHISIASININYQKWTFLQQSSHRFNFSCPKTSCETWWEETCPSPLPTADHSVLPYLGINMNISIYYITMVLHDSAHSPGNGTRAADQTLQTEWNQSSLVDVSVILPEQETGDCHSLRPRQWRWWEDNELEGWTVCECAWDAAWGDVTASNADGFPGGANGSGCWWILVEYDWNAKPQQHRSEEEVEATHTHTRVFTVMILRV